MFFGSRKRRQSAGGVSHPSAPTPILTTAEPELVPWSAWRSAEQKATRAWNEWLAADHHGRPELYRHYVLALAEEEQAAAELERTITLAGNAQDVSVSSASTARSEQSRPSYR